MIWNVLKIIQAIAGAVDVWTRFVKPKIDRRKKIRQLKNLKKRRRNPRHLDLAKSASDEKQNPDESKKRQGEESQDEPPKPA